MFVVSSSLLSQKHEPCCRSNKTGVCGPAFRSSGHQIIHRRGTASPRQSTATILVGIRGPNPLLNYSYCLRDLSDDHLVLAETHQFPATSFVCGLLLVIGLRAEPYLEAFFCTLFVFSLSYSFIIFRPVVAQINSMANCFWDFELLADLDGPLIA